MKDGTFYSWVFGAAFAVTALLFGSAQETINTVQDENQRLRFRNRQLIDEANAPVEHPPHDVRVQLVMRSDGMAFVIVEGMFMHKFPGACSVDA